jgi:hypothetical protein
MPTTPAEAQQINQVVNRHIELEKMKSLISDLFDEVGLTTQNYSLRKTLLMLRQLYEPTYMIPVADVKRLVREYIDTPHVQNVGMDEYIGVSHHEYLDFVARTYPECKHTLPDSSS